MSAAAQAFKFQLTTSRRGRRKVEEDVRKAGYFNSLPHAEVDRSVAVYLPPGQHFNSLPHAEVDTDVRAGYIGRSISTHYLTQR